MSARSGLAGKRTSRPHLGPSRVIFCVGRKNQKNAQILPIFLGGPLLLSTLGGAIGISAQFVPFCQPFSARATRSMMSKMPEAIIFKPLGKLLHTTAFLSQLTSFLQGGPVPCHAMSWLHVPCQAIFSRVMPYFCVSCRVMNIPCHVMSGFF